MILFGDQTIAIEEDSEPPAKPTIYGPANGAINKEQRYSAITRNLEGDTLYYMFN